MGEAIDVRARALEALYSAALGETGWDTFLAGLGTALPGGKTSLFFHSPETATGGFALTSGYEPAMLAAYNEHYAPKNPWMPKTAIRPIGLGVRAEWMLPRHDLEKTEFYADFLKPQGLITGVGVTIIRQAGTNFMLSVLSQAVDDERADQAAALLGEMAPHLRRVFGYFGRRARQAALPGMSDSILDLSNLAVLLVDSRLRPIARNGLAERTLATGTGVGVTPTGRIQIASEDAMRALGQMVAARSRTGRSSPRTLSFWIKGWDGRPALQVTLAPYKHDTEAARYFAGPMVLLLIDDLRAQMRMAWS